MPLIFASLCGSTPKSKSALIKWFVIELWPQPAQSVVGRPLYVSRGRPMMLRFVVLMVNP